MSRSPTWELATVSRIRLSAVATGQPREALCLSLGSLWLVNASVSTSTAALSAQSAGARTTARAVPPRIRVTVHQSEVCAQKRVLRRRRWPAPPGQGTELLPHPRVVRRRRWPPLPGRGTAWLPPRGSFPPCVSSPGGWWSSLPGQGTAWCPSQLSPIPSRPGKTACPPRTGGRAG